MRKTRVLIADDHAVLRAGLRMLIEAQPDMAVVAEIGDGFEVPGAARRAKPDVVILDITMPGPGFRQTIEELRVTCPAARILVLTMHDDPAYLRSALRAGASGFVVKRAADSELISAIRAVRSGRTFVDSSRMNEATATGAGAASGGAAQKKLSTREREVLRLLAQGNTNQQIAERIHLSVKTVETYRTRLYEKLGLRGRAELFQFAVAEGLLAPDGVP